MGEWARTQARETVVPEVAVGFYAIDLCFSNSSTEKNLLKGLLKSRLLGPSPKILIPYLWGSSYKS